MVSGPTGRVDFALPYSTYTQKLKLMWEAVMATQKTRSQATRFGIGGALAALGLSSLIGGMGHEACVWSAFFEIPLRSALGALASVILAAGHLLVPYLFGHARLLESLLQVTVCGGKLFLTFLGAA